MVDLLFASAGIEGELAAAAEDVEALPGLRVPVATLGHLVALKVLSRDDRTRPFDRADLGALVARADAAALASARSALELVQARGFHAAGTCSPPSMRSWPTWGRDEGN